MEWPLSGLRVADLSAGIAPARLGEHNEDILAGLLGLTAGEIAQLGQDGIIGTRPASTDSSRGFR